MVPVVPKGGAEGGNDVRELETSVWGTCGCLQDPGAGLKAGEASAADGAQREAGGCCCIPGSSSSARSRAPGGSRLPLSLSPYPSHTPSWFQLAPLSSSLCWLVPQGPQFLPWNPFLSSWLCSSAPPSALGAPQSPQPCSETKPFLFTRRPHFPSSTSESFPFPPSALQSSLPAVRIVQVQLSVHPPWLPLVLPRASGPSQDSNKTGGSCFQPS